MADIEQYMNAINTLDQIAREVVAGSSFITGGFVPYGSPRVVKPRGRPYYLIEFTYERRYGGDRTTTHMRSLDDAIARRIRNAHRIVKKFGGDYVPIITRIL